MQDLIYHVATTMDGYIAKPDGTVPGFAMTGDHADAYQAQLAAYSTIVMGRATYEIGYAYGMKPGDLPYGDRPHHVVSRNIALPDRANLHVVRNDALATIDRLKAEVDGPIYLCGGGKLAGFLLAEGRIDAIRLKVSPLVYGQGIRLFEDFDGVGSFTLTSTETYESGVVLLDYRKS
ncbi:MAG: dihydrofolate reductase [Devosia sp.]|uniref:dihydrofolate reductase family protein n=1 Tax=Devosia sp. TaxID=1871048 RepID=UPI0024CD3E11|nr:dihydrofolate reductase family protein [Devosia sp.]UYO01047.1 MAG: dihydrofolate reductase [Devosia sp.]